MLLLAVADVKPEAVADDYDLTADALTTLFDLVGRPDDRSVVEGLLAAGGMTARGSILATLEDLDVARYLRDAGVSVDDVEELRRRLVG